MNENRLTMEDVHKIMKLDTVESCKKYLDIMLDFYFDIITSPEGQESSSDIEECGNLWLQTIFSKGCNFYSLLDGFTYNKGILYLNPIIDFSVLFTIARSLYESLISFELLYILPKTKDQQIIVFNLFKAHGLNERLRVLHEEERNKNPEKISDEEENINECKRNIEDTELYKKLNAQERKTIENAFGRKYHYIFEGDNKLKGIKYEESFFLLNPQGDILKPLYPLFSLHCHPSYLSLLQFEDAYSEDKRTDIELSQYATQCMLAFMSIFIIDYMKINLKVKAIYDSLEESRRFAIGMYEDAMRGENKFTIIRD